MSYSIDFREKVLSTKEQKKLTLSEVSKRFKVGIASIARWSKRIEAKLTRNKPTTKLIFLTLNWHI